MQEIEVISLYVRHIADRMNLRDWRFSVQFDDRLPTLASIECVDNRRYAVITIGPQFIESDDTVKRYGIVHELVHCHQTTIQTYFDTLETLHGPVHQTLRKNHDNHIETAADALASAIAESMPTPEEFSDRNRKTKG